MKRIFLRIFKPTFIKILDYTASYPSRWADGGTPVEVLTKKFHKKHLDELEKLNYLTIEDESIGLDDLTHKVYALQPKGNTVAHRRKNNIMARSENPQGLSGWLMGIVGAIIAGLVLFYIFGVGK